MAHLQQFLPINPLLIACDFPVGTTPSNLHQTGHLRHNTYCMQGKDVSRADFQGLHRLPAACLICGGGRGRHGAGGGIGEAELGDAGADGESSRLGIAPCSSGEMESRSVLPSLRLSYKLQH